ncbi:MAG TPA: hypothetical protein VGK27_06165 [Candidatus Deferrimicrobiaceae bacterium]
MSGYDSLYLAVAMVEKACMVTDDRKSFDALAGTPAAGHLLWIENVT